MAQAKNYYEVIGVARDATAEEIRSAYRRLAKRYHPDAHPGDRECERRFREINEAYGVLGDPRQRERYDADSAGTQAGSKARTGPQNAGSKIDYEDIFRRSNDMFERFMGIKR